MSDELVIRKFRINLTATRDGERFPVPFTHCRFEASSQAAIAYIQLNNLSDGKVKIFNGRRLKNHKAKEFYISNVAQPGEWIDIYYLSGVIMGAPDVIDNALTAAITGAVLIDSAVPVNVSVSGSITGIAEPLPPMMMSGVGYFGAINTTALQTIVAPAANTGGVVVRGIQMLISSNHTRVMTKASAPASINDATAKTLALCSFSVSTFNSGAFPYTIPAGEGIYIISAGTNSLVGINYEVL